MSSHNVETITRWFGLTATHASPPNPPSPLLLPAENQILLLAGPSGSGKSTLLRHYARALPHTLNLPALRLPPRPIVDLFPTLLLTDALLLLSRVGLAEAALYIKRPNELSDGQRFRLRLALALHKAAARTCKSNPTTLLCDEFCSLLDPESAAVVSHTFRKAVDRTRNLRAILATSRPDLLMPLRPDQVIRCDFGRYELQPWRATNVTNGHE